MTISYSENRSLKCPGCGTIVQSDVWLILDSQEQPEHMQALHQGKLNTICCPQCSTHFVAQTPFLLHDAASKFVIVAIPSDSAEYQWREEVRELHSFLIERVPNAEHHTYLGDVQIAQDVPGILHILKKHAQKGKKPPRRMPGRRIEDALPGININQKKPDIRYEQAPVAETAVADEPAEAELMHMVQKLVGADTVDGFRATVEHYPFLQKPQADNTLRQLADRAFEQREYDFAECLNHVRQLLHHLLNEQTVQPTDQPHAAEPVPADIPDPFAEMPLNAYHALLQSCRNEELLQAIEQYSVLLDPWFAATLDDAVDQVLDEGYERLAQILEYRRELITLFRQEIENGTNYAEKNPPV